MIYPSSADSLDTAPFPINDEFFGVLQTIDVATPKDAASLLVCVDYVNAHSEEVARWKIGQVVGNASVSSCVQALGAGYCGLFGMNALRALCPETCGCANSLARSAAGFFASPTFGCPDQCGTFMSISEELDHLDESATTLACSDLPDEWFTPQLLVGAQAYLSGLFDYLMHKDGAGFKQRLGTSLPQLGQHLQLSPNQYPDFVQAMLNGTAENEFQEFRWTLGPGVPHPRGLTGCAFFTSWEVTAILGVNLCDVGEFRSIRGVCATSCGCQQGNATNPECPVACTEEPGLHGVHH
jgi:hypothetical protein